MLLDMDMDVAIQRLTQDGAQQDSQIQLTGVYHNLRLTSVEL